MLSFDRGSSRLLDWKDTRPHKLRLAMTLAVIGSRIPEEMKHQPFQLWLKPNSVHCLQGFMYKYNQAYQNIPYLMDCTYSENKLSPGTFSQWNCDCGKITTVEYWKKQTADQRTSFVMTF
jgi:hypothetical protein